MKKVFVSGCYDIVHAGHIQFFEEARALGDYLIVSFASEPVLWHHKQRKPSIPDEHKKVLLEKALDVCTTEKKVVLTTFTEDASAKEYTDYIIETIEKLK